MHEFVTYKWLFTSKGKKKSPTVSDKVCHPELIWFEDRLGNWRLVSKKNSLPPDQLSHHAVGVKADKNSLPPDQLSHHAVGVKADKKNNVLNVLLIKIQTEPPHDKTNKMTCAPSKDSDRPGHPPSLIRVFALRTKKPCVLSFPLSA